MTQFHLKPRTTRQPQDTIDGHTRPSTRLVDGHTRLVTIDWRLSVNLRDQKVQKFHLLFGPFPNNRIDFFIASTRTWVVRVE